MPVPKKQIVLITGAHAGLGFEMVKSLCASPDPYEIFVGARSLVRAQQAAKAAVEQFPSTTSRTWPIQVDIEDDESIKGAFIDVESKFDRLDALVNNAGMLPGENHEEFPALLSLAGAQLDQQIQSRKMTTRQMWNASWNVNTVGTQIMTATFIPLLLESTDPRLIFMTSETSTLNGTETMKLPINMSPPKGWPKMAYHGVSAYRSSKCGLNMLMREWYRILKKDGVKVWCLSSGYLATGTGRDRAEHRSPGSSELASAGNFLRSVLEGKRDSDVGKVILQDGVQPW